MSMYEEEEEEEKEEAVEVEEEDEKEAMIHVKSSANHPKAREVISRCEAASVISIFKVAR